MVGRVTELRTCALCGKPIGHGEAWLQRDDAATDVAHAGCVYRDEPSTEVQARWRPADDEAITWP